MINIDSYNPQVGDIILVDSNKFGAKIVKFFMTAPTVYQYIWRSIFKTQKNVQYYHVAMMSSADGDIIEQQWKVKESVWNKNNNQIIFRKKDLTSVQQNWLLVLAKKDIGKNWDILNMFGKFLTWLTGIPLFAMFVQWPDQEICVNRVAAWYNKIGEKFGALTHSEITTQSMYEYLMLNKHYDVVYVKRS